MFWGKVFGILFGFLWLGPVGILLGGWIGHQFDRGFLKARVFKNYFETEQRRYSQRQNRQSQHQYHQQHSQQQQQQNSQKNHSYSYSTTYSPLYSAYEMLGISPQASIAEIKKAYRKKISQYHPDKLIAKGLPEAMLKHATEMTQKIRAAYEKIREAKGF